MMRGMCHGYSCFGKGDIIINGELYCKDCAEKIFGHSKNPAWEKGTDMKFKVRDKVRVIADHNRLRDISIIDYDMTGMVGEVIGVYENYYDVKIEKGLTWALYEQDIELIPSAEAQSTNGLETFSGGATRTSLDGKLSYVKGLSPVVLRRYLQYLAKHRKQPDGSMREFDNWKQGIPIDRYFDGLGRHFVALWLLLDGFEHQDDPGQDNLEDILCAILFNAMGILHEQLKREGDKNENNPARSDV